MMRQRSVLQREIHISLQNLLSYVACFKFFFIVQVSFTEG